MDEVKRCNVQKYENRNPIQRFLMNRFFDYISERINALSPETVLDFGSGEGFFWRAMERRGVQPKKVLGIELSKDAVAMARRIAPNCEFSTADLFDIHPEDERFDLVMAVEVLEHLQLPERYLRHLARLSSGSVLLSVPHEPWFKLCNLLRGRDILALGNHPDHRNHWNPDSFRRFLSPIVDLSDVRPVFPWLVAVGTPRHTENDTG